jgi:hypothetical protein
MRFASNRRNLNPKKRVKDSVAFVYTEATVCFCAYLSHKGWCSLVTIERASLSFVSSEGLVGPEASAMAAVLFFFLHRPDTQTSRYL